MSLTGTSQFTEKARIVLQANKEGTFSTDQTTQINYLTAIPFKTNARTNYAHHLLNGIKETYKKDLKIAIKALDFINENIPEIRVTKSQHTSSKRKRSAKDNTSSPKPKKQSMSTSSNILTTEQSSSSNERFFDLLTELEAISKRHSGPNGPIISSPECRTWRLNHKAKIDYAKEQLEMADRTNTISLALREYKLDELRQDVIDISKKSRNTFTQSCREVQLYLKWKQEIVKAEKEYGVDPSLLKGVEWLKHHAKDTLLKQHHEKIRKSNKEAGDSQARFKAYKKCLEKEKAKPTLSEQQVTMIKRQYQFKRNPIVTEELGADLRTDAWIIIYPRRIPEKDASTIFSNATKAFRYATEAETTKSEILKNARDMERRLAGRAFPYECKPLSGIPPHLRYLMKKTEKKGNGDGLGRVNCSPRPMTDALERYARTIGRSCLSEQYNNMFEANDTMVFDNIQTANSIEQLGNAKIHKRDAPSSLDWEQIIPVKKPAGEAKEPIKVSLKFKKSAAGQKSAKGVDQATKKDAKIIWKVNPIST